MDDPIRIEKVPNYANKVRENGKSGGDEEAKKKREKIKKNKKDQAEIEDGHVDTLA